MSLVAMNIKLRCMSLQIRKKIDFLEARINELERKLNRRNKWKMAILTNFASLFLGLLVANAVNYLNSFYFDNSLLNALGIITHLGSAAALVNALSRKNGH